MRLAIVLILMIAALPVRAEFWTQYSNSTFGYDIDVPPGFEGHGEAANGEGQGFYLVAAEQMLVVWGGALTTGLEGVAGDVVADNVALDWNISSHASTPEWASFSGVRGPRSFFQRMILLCDRQSYAAMRLDFPTADTGAIEPVMQGLARSFLAKGC